MALTHSGMILRILVSWCKRSSAARAFFMQYLGCSLNVRWGSIQTLTHYVASLLNQTKLSSRLIVSHTFGWKSSLWPLLSVRSAGSIFAVSHRRSCMLVHFMLCSVQALRLLTTWFTLWLGATHLRSSKKERPLTPWTLSSTQGISPALCIAKRIGDMGMCCCTPASKG